MKSKIRLLSQNPGYVTIYYCSHTRERQVLGYEVVNIIPVLH
jgi:hypothetical protein